MRLGGWDQSEIRYSAKVLSCEAEGHPGFLLLHISPLVNGAYEVVDIKGFASGDDLVRIEGLRIRVPQERLKIEGLVVGAGGGYLVYQNGLPITMGVKLAAAPHLHIVSRQQSHRLIHLLIEPEPYDFAGMAMQLRRMSFPVHLFEPSLQQGRVVIWGGLRNPASLPDLDSSTVGSGWSVAANSLRGGCAGRL